MYEDAGSSDSDTSRALEAYNARMNELLGGDEVNDDLQQKSKAERPTLVYKGPKKAL